MNRLQKALASRRWLVDQVEDLMDKWWAAREERDAWQMAAESWRSAAENADYLREQLHRVAAERDEERGKRLYAEEKLLEYHETKTIPYMIVMDNEEE